jgi:amino acid adenylation domain-containing protein
MMNCHTYGYRLSPQQRRIWALQQNGSAYNAQCLIQVCGEVKPQLLREALQAVVNRQDILRTTYHYEPGMLLPIQVIRESAALLWRDVDLRGIGFEEQENAVEKLFREGKDQNFNFGQGPLISVTLLTLSSRDQALIITLPSLCADALSLRLIAGALGRAYYACLNGDSMGGETVQYVQFAEWQNDLLEGDSANVGKEYWAAKVAHLFEEGGRELSEPVQAGKLRPGSLTFKIDAARMEGVNRKAKEYAVEPADFLLTCWLILLWRFANGSRYIVVGKMFQCRAIEDLRGAIGHFAKALPVSCDFDDESSFSEVLTHTHRVVEEAHAWQEYFDWPGRVEREAGGRYYEYGYAYERAGVEEEYGGVKFRVGRSWCRSERFKLKMVCEERGGEIGIELEYDPEFYDEAEVERLGRAYEEVVRSAAECAEIEVRDIELMGEEERRRVVEEWNETGREYVGRGGVHELFEESAREWPERVAVVYEDEAVSYRELNRRANQLGRYLRERGVGPEVRVGIYMERGVEMVVGVLGTLKAGGAYVPLDPDYPAERLDYMVEDGGVGALLTKWGAWPGAGCGEVVRMDEERSEIERRSGEEVSSGVGLDNLAYVIYTSGSTGRPKGVMVKHECLINYLSWSAGVYLRAETRGTIAHSPLSFDLTVTSLLAPLIVGQPVELVSDGRGIDGLWRALTRNRGRRMVKLTPSHLDAINGLLKEEGEVAVGGMADALVVGGERLMWEQVRRWRVAGVRVINEYGPTETTVGSCMYEVIGEEESSADVPIGRPIANTETYLLDERMAPSPIGMAGEIYIGGVGVARGYLNQPGLTAERFLPHPFGRRAGARLYRTGDVGRYQGDGRIDFLGRRDQQVKIRGYRIELGEIEAGLRRHPSVLEALALEVTEEVGTDKRLIAYVVAEPGQVTSSELQRHLEGIMPAYMTPSAFVFLEKMPLTCNGKVDRVALMKGRIWREEETHDYVEPRTATERLLADIWAKVLGVERVGIQSDFFKLGGHSILATQLISRLNKVFQVKLPIQAVFDARTISALAAVIERYILEEIEGLSESEAQRLL